MTTSELHPAIARLRGGLIVSCQAAPPDVMVGPDNMAMMALSAEGAGAVGIRANGPDDIAAIRRMVSLPIIGIFKQDLPGLGIRITPSLESARVVAQAGADIIAIDATRRGPEEGRLAAPDFIRLIKAELGVPVMADCATFDEAVAAAEAGADIVATTMSGYTAYSPPAKQPDYALVEALVKALQTPVISEGRISTPEQARRIMDVGAFAVVVGSMITRPRWIVQHYVAALREDAASSDNAAVPVIAVDIGSTTVSAAVSHQAPHLSDYRQIASPASDGDQAALDQAITLIEQSLDAAKDTHHIQAIGVSTDGQPDSLGRINGLDVRGQLESRFGLPVIVENSGQLAALAEARYGAGRGFKSVLSVTLGITLETGFVVNGQLYRGERGAGPMLGHITVEKNGRQCSCGRRGCLEQYVNSAALVAEYNALLPDIQRVTSAEAVIQAASNGDDLALRALSTIGDWLGYGLGIAADLLDPSVIVIGGDLAQVGDWLLEAVRRSLPGYPTPARRECPVVGAKFGATAGLIGAAVLASR